MLHCSQCSDQIKEHQTQRRKIELRINERLHQVMYM
jgi:hypothetical protein